MVVSCVQTTSREDPVPPKPGHQVPLNHWEETSIQELLPWGVPKQVAGSDCLYSPNICFLKGIILTPGEKRPFSPV